VSDQSPIEWTDATWNPCVGCSLVSPGCTHCYAMRLAHRLALMGSTKYQGLTEMTKAGAVWTGQVRLDEDALDQPLRWKKPRRIFVNSMSDLFHEALDAHEIAQIFAVMATAQRHAFQVLTKRPERMRAELRTEEFWDQVDCFITGIIEERVDPLHRRRDDIRATTPEIGVDYPLPNAWLGVSVEDQARADERIPHLLETPAAVRFLSCEPLLGPIDIDEWLDDSRLGGLPGSAHRDTPRRGIDWVIVGGESGPDARPMHPDWARSIRDQCGAAGVPFFMKQMARRAPIPDDLLIREWPHAQR
jgi:protein gp37